MWASAAAEAGDMIGIAAADGIPLKVKPVGDRNRYCQNKESNFDQDDDEFAGPVKQDRFHNKAIAAIDLDDQSILEYPALPDAVLPIAVHSIAVAAAAAAEVSLPHLDFGIGYLEYLEINHDYQPDHAFYIQLTPLPLQTQPSTMRMMAPLKTGTRAFAFQQFFRCSIS